MEIKNFDSVCAAYHKGAEMKRLGEMVYTALVNAKKQMTATEVRDALPIQYSRQRVTAYLRKLIELGLVVRYEESTGEKVTITPPENPYYQPRRMRYKEVFDANGNSLGEQYVQERISEPFEVEVKVVYFKAV
jgi:DNA-binding transcriptional regulator GbsR (MarR family)